jgi:rubrerythrin
MAKVKKPDMRITVEEYGELADLCIKAAKKVKKMSKEHAHLQLLAEKCIAKSDKMNQARKNKARGPTKQKKKAERWKCVSCNHKFAKPVDRKHCPTCDSTDIQQLKLTAFTTPKVDLEPGEREEADTEEEEEELEAELPAI